MSQQVLLTHLEEGVLTLTLNRPKVNAFDGELISALASALKRAASDDGVRVVALIGAGDIFSAGQDLTAYEPRTKAPYRYHLQVTYNPLVLQIRRLEKPVRCPTTVSTSRSPTLVWALRRRTLTSKPFALRPSRTRAATRRSPTEPGSRLGALPASCCRVAKAPMPSKASEASGVVTPRGCSRSEKPTSTNTNRTGRKAAR